MAQNAGAAETGRTVFGIDLGTTYSCISHVDEYGRPEVLTNLDNEPTTPSVILFDSAEDFVVGKQAKRQARIKPENIAALVKRHMGDSDWRLTLHGQEWSAPALSSLILRSRAASKRGGRPQCGESNSSRPSAWRQSASLMTTPGRQRGTRCSRPP